MKLSSLPPRSAFTLVEILITVAILSILATLGTVVVSNSRDAAKTATLHSNLSTINSSVNAYLASNGDLKDITDPAKVIAKLKTSSSVASARTINGFRGGFLDPRIEAIVQSKEEAEGEGARVYWNPLKMRFEIVEEKGEAGIKEFRINEDLAEAEVNYEDRRSTMELAKSSSWIWDYEDKAVGNPGSPTKVPLGTAPGSTTPPTPNPTTPPTPPSPISPLLSPLFSVPPGTYDYTTYNLNLSLIDPNTSGASKLFYSVDFGPWTEYAGESITANPATEIRAQAISIVPKEYSNSLVSNGNYEASPVLLSAPLINPSFQSFGLFTQNDIIVTIVDLNVPGNSQTQYRIDGGDWEPYPFPFVLLRANYPDGALVEARTISSGSPYFLPSPVSTTSLGIESLDLAGNTTGEFYNPIGNNDMETNLASGQRSK